MTAQLSAIYAIAKRNEDYSALKSQHFSTEAYVKCFEVIKAIEESLLPSRIEESLIQRFDIYYDQIVKAKDVSPVLGRTVAKAALRQMSETLSYLSNELNFITDDHLLAVSLYSEMEPTNDYAMLRYDLQKNFSLITELFVAMVDEITK